MPWFRRGSRSTPGPGLGHSWLCRRRLARHCGIAAKKPPLTPKQSAVLDVLCRADEPLTTADVCRLAKCTDVPIQSLKKQGLLHTVKKRLPVGLAPGSADSSSEPAPANGGSPKGDAKTTTDRPRLILTADQSATLERLAPALGIGSDSPRS